jgi:hypothetical protein
MALPSGSLLCSYFEASPGQSQCAGRVLGLMPRLATARPSRPGRRGLRWMPSGVLVMPFSEGFATNTIARGHGGRMERTAAEERMVTNAVRSPVRLATRCMRVVSRAAARRLAGRRMARRRASLDVPAPGGPTIRRLWSERLHQIQHHPSCCSCRLPAQLSPSRGGSHDDGQRYDSASSSVLYGFCHEFHGAISTSWMRT